MRVISSGQITPPDGLYRILELVTTGSDVETTILCIYSDSVNGVIGLDKGRYIKGARLVGDQTQGIPAIAALLTVKDGKYVLFRATPEEFQAVDQTLTLEIESILKQHFEGMAPTPAPTLAAPVKPEETQPIPPSVVKESRTIFEMRASKASAAAAEAAAAQEEEAVAVALESEADAADFPAEIESTAQETEASIEEPLPPTESVAIEESLGDVPPAILGARGDIVSSPQSDIPPVAISEPVYAIPPLPRAPQANATVEEPPSFGFHSPPIPPLPQSRQEEQPAAILEPVAVGVHEQHESAIANYPPSAFPAFQRQSFSADSIDKAEVQELQVEPSVLAHEAPQTEPVQPEVVQTEPVHAEMVQPLMVPMEQEPAVPPAAEAPQPPMPPSHETLPEPTIHTEPPQNISWPRIPPAYGNEATASPPSSVPPITRNERNLVQPGPEQTSDDGRSALGLRQSFDTPELLEQPSSPPSASPYILLACAVMIISFGVCVGVYLHQSQSKSIIETSSSVSPATTAKTETAKPVEPIKTVVPSSSLDKAKAELAAGNAKAALEECTAHLKNDPINADIRRVRIAAATQVSDWQTVVDDSFMLLKTATATEKNELLLTRADAYFKLGKLDSAQVDYEELLKLDPQNRRAQQGIDDCRRTIGGQQIAQETSTAQDHGSAEVSRLTEVLQSNPQDWNSRKQLASTYLQKGQAIEAAQQWQQLQAAGAVSVNEDLSFASQLAMTDHRSAASVYRNCIARNPRLADVRCLLAKEYAASGAVPEARAILQDGINISSSPDEKEMLRQMIRQVNETSAPGY